VQHSRAKLKSEVVAELRYDCRITCLGRDDAIRIKSLYLLKGCNITKLIQGFPDSIWPGSSVWQSALH